MMIDILENQHIHRRTRSLSSANLTGKKYACSSGFIGQFRQNPVHARRRQTEKTRLSPGVLKKKFFPASGRPFPEKKAVNSTFEQQTVPKPTRRSSGFSFPVPSLMTLAVIAGILLFSMIALNWQDLGIPVSFSLNLNTDEQAELNLASYAGIPLHDTPVQYEDIPLDLVEVFEWKAHTVKRGESVYQISRNYDLSMDAIITSNNISNARRLAEGTVLRIPNMDGIPYAVKKGDSLSKIAVSMNVPLEVILDVNDIRTDAISPGQMLFIPGARMAPDELKLAMGELFMYPIKGRLTDSYGWRIDPIANVRRFHAALDLAAPSGLPVKAAMDAKVSATGTNNTYGKFIILSHAGGYQSLYAHLSSIAVNQGDNVVQGRKIGEVGSTGYSTGPHLHFAIFKNGRPINPLDLLH